MYRTIKYQINKDNPIYSYCFNSTLGFNNMYNASLFRIRQVMTAMNKEEDAWTDNEKAVINEIKTILPVMDHKHKMPTKEKWLLSYDFLWNLMVKSHNSDYYSDLISSQTAQSAIKSACNDMNSFFKANKAYKRNPKKFSGKPKLPHYKKSGGHSTVICNNQDCVIYSNKKNKNDKNLYLKFPYTTLRLILGSFMNPESRLKQVEIKPFHDIFIVNVTIEEQVVTKSESEIKRFCNIDIGVDNFAAITNNVGQPCLLFKGGIPKSINQYYNKSLAKIMSNQTKGTTAKFVMTDESHKLTLRRDNQLKDYMHKVAKYIINWCVKNEIDTIIVGSNKFWKQETSMNNINNQNFVFLPFDTFKGYLQYLSERNGINFILREESYTSQANFLNNDYIPTYGQDDDLANFSGKRTKRIYKTDSGIILNSDLNGSANIGRKNCTNQQWFGIMPDFNKIIIIKHPDKENIKDNKAKQKAAYTEQLNGKQFSYSKSKRIHRKHIRNVV